MARAATSRAATEKAATADDTRERLIAAAGQLFADRGFQKVTVREICREANANVAAVNYHFGDKLGLYREVLEVAIRTLRSVTESARAAGEGRPAEERLRNYIRIFVDQARHARRHWVRGLMFREMADPTPALDELVNRGLRPRLEYLSEIVAELMGCDVHDERVLPCTGSLQAQCVMCLPNAVAERLRPGPPPSEEDIAQLVDHIATFSLAGIRAIAATPENSRVADGRQQAVGSRRSAKRQAGEL
jgi:TetR/AcrR family transcriptional regulator, regulator of cefoperazone and chloramphenicol sensitivity